MRAAQSLAEAQIAALQHVVDKQRVSARKMTACLRESERQRSKLVSELEEARKRHELDTAQGDDITFGLEKDRIRLKQELEAETAEKQRLEVALKESVASMEEEKSRQKQIVLVLLADRKKLMKLYLEEKKRSEDLAQILAEEKSKMDTMAAGLEEESKRSLAMEAELEKHMSQFGSERQQLQSRLVADERRYRDLEDALRKARADAEHFKKQLSEAHRVAMSQAAPPANPFPTAGTAAAAAAAVVPGATAAAAAAVAAATRLQPMSVSPTPVSPLNRQPVGGGPTAQQSAYANYSTYSTYGQVVPGLNSSITTPAAGGASGAGTWGGPPPSAGGGGRLPPASAGGGLVARPAGLSPNSGGHSVIRSQSGPIAASSHPALPSQTGGQSHTLKYHSSATSGKWDLKT